MGCAVAGFPAPWPVRWLDFPHRCRSSEPKWFFSSQTTTIRLLSSRHPKCTIYMRKKAKERASYGEVHRYRKPWAVRWLDSPHRGLFGGWISRTVGGMKNSPEQNWFSRWTTATIGFLSSRHPKCTPHLHESAKGRPSNRRPKKRILSELL